MFQRRLTQAVESRLSEARVVCVLGARQVGKSTLVNAIAQDRQWPIYELDSPATLANVSNDPSGFLADVGSPAVIDEVQMVPELLVAIKRKVDRDNVRGQFLITGSANLQTLPTVSDALPGRVDYLTLGALTQAELREVKGKSFLDRILSGKIPRVDGAEVGRSPYLTATTIGGYPEAQSRTPAGLQGFFESYIHSLLGRDLPRLLHIGTEREKLERLLSLIAANSGGLTNYSALASDLQLSDKTVRQRLEDLESLYLVYRLPSWSGSHGKRVVRNPRYFISDSGLFCHLLGIDGQRVLADHSVVGRAFETFVVTELLRQRTYSSVRARPYFYRDRDGREVDLLFELASGEIVGIEIKAGSSTGANDFRALRYLRDVYGQRFICGLILTTGEQTLRFEDRLYSAPISALWSDES